VIAMNDLNSRFASGQSGAVRELYGVYAGSVFAVAYRVLSDRSLAEEAVQQTFLQAWRAAQQYDPSRDVGPWLHTIARRAAIDLYRRERRHRAEQVTDESVAELPPSLEATWAAWEVRRAVDSLPDDERAVLHATHFLGLTHKEAAQQLGLPLGTVKSRSHRAYRRLAGLLAHVGEVPA
jgi:RNA polymerase sigma-70 factor (ECF subfamily)